MPIGESYRKAYSAIGTDKTCAENGSHTKNKPAVKAYYDKMNEKIENKRALSRAKKRDLLSEFATDEDTDVSKRIKAIEVDNLMSGDNKPTEVTVTGLGALLNKVREGTDE